MFIRQTRYCSGVLKLSWATLKYVWEILLPAATWQRNPRMESAAAPFQIGHLWWHEPLYHHRQLQPDLTTMCCQRFLRISNLGRRQHPTQQSLSLQSGKHPNLVYRLYQWYPQIETLPHPTVGFEGTSELRTLFEREPRNEPMDCHSVMGVHLLTFTAKKIMHGAYFRLADLASQRHGNQNTYVCIKSKLHQRRPQTVGEITHVFSLCRL